MYKILRTIRKEKNISILEMGKVIDKQASTYAKKERGEIPFSLEEAKLISNYLGETMDIFKKDVL